MALNAAIERLEQLQEEALKADNPQMELLAIALLELTKGMRAELKKLNQKIDAVPK